MEIMLITADGQKIAAENITEIVFTRTAGAACDSLSVNFKNGEKIGEISEVYAEENGERIFTGFCDCMKTTSDKDGFEIYIYSRSSACLLVDSQAEPYTYNKPTALQLFIMYAEPLGFKSCLPDIKCSRKYEISSGVSRFAAINSLVSVVSGNDIFINADNEMKILEPSGEITRLSGDNILSEKEIINRSEPLAAIHYKKELSAEYNCHMLSQYAEKYGLKSEKYVNLNSLAQWQRSYKVGKMLSESFYDYRLLELTYAGYFVPELYSRFSFDGKTGAYDDYILTETVYSKDGSGEKTKLKFRKNIDLEEVNYVD